MRVFDLSKLCTAFVLTFACLSGSMAFAQDLQEQIFGQPKNKFSGAEDPRLFSYLSKHSIKTDSAQFCGIVKLKCSSIKQVWSLTGGNGARLVHGTDRLGEYFAFAVPHVHRNSDFPVLTLSDGSIFFEVIALSERGGQCSPSSVENIFKIWSGERGIVLRVTSAAKGCDTGTVQTTVGGELLVLGEVAEISETKSSIYTISVVRK